MVNGFEGIINLKYACLLQCIFRSSVHLDPSYGAGELADPVARHAQSVPHQRHLLLLFGHGALHQGPRWTDRHAEGTLTCIFTHH